MEYRRFTPQSGHLLILVATVPSIWLMLLSAPAALSAAGVAGEGNPFASASPSDISPPLAEEPAADQPDLPEVSCCGQREPVCCRPRGRLVLGLLRRLRLRRCCPCACVADLYAWKDLFDGQTLDGWEVADFGGDGEVYIEDGRIVMDTELGMTGVTWRGDLPRDNYELEYEGLRLAGSDFFATVTFPVGKDECSLVTGGWGGTVVGLSTIDFCDASSNDTTTYREFEDNRWYRFRVRVTQSKIEAWIDGQRVVDQQRAGHVVGIRGECEPNRPLGFATFYTKGAVRDVRIRNLEPPAGR
jgi:hypothetical protein